MTMIPAIDAQGVVMHTDNGETWRRVSTTNPRPMYFSQIRIDPTNDLVFVGMIQNLVAERQAPMSAR